MKKRLLLVFVFVIMAIAIITGCSSKTTKETKATQNRTTTNSQSTSESEIKYKVKYVNYDGAVLVEGEVYPGEALAYTGGKPHRPDDDNYSYEFSGWSPEIDVVYSDTTYVAQYKSTDLPYSIHYVLNGGTCTDGETLKDHKYKNFEFYIYKLLPNLQKDGYYFVGWKIKDKDGIVKYSNSGSMEPEFEFKNDLTFEAVFEEASFMHIICSLYNPYTDELLEQYSNFTPSLIKSNHYTPYSIVNVYFNGEGGYEFIGWYKDGELFSEETSFDYYLEYEDITFEIRLYCSKITFTIKTFEGQDEYGDIGIINSNNTIEYSDSIEISSYTGEKTRLAAKKTGSYNFLGWYDEHNNKYSDSEIVDFYTPLNHQFLIAKWNIFTVTYDLDGGVNDSRNPDKFVLEDDIIPLFDATKDGYAFGGWWIDGVCVDKLTGRYARNLTVKAKWLELASEDN